MGLTTGSTGFKAVDSKPDIKKRTPNDKIIALAGNPNVGKSTVFNNLTGMNQHTGNWPGKTVASAQGYCSTEKNSYVLVDIPGTYSLMAHSAEEEVARNFICFGEPDATVVVCDATCLERNLNLVLQTLEISSNVIVCVNLMDEAKRKGITIDTNKLSELLGVPVVSAIARKKNSLKALTNALDEIDSKSTVSHFKIDYPKSIENAIEAIEKVARYKFGDKINSRWLSLKLLDSDDSLINEINAYFDCDILSDKAIVAAVNTAKDQLQQSGIVQAKIKDTVVSSIVKRSEDIARKVITYKTSSYNATDRRIDRILTSKAAGYPIMMVLLALTFWLTISGANYPSQLLSSFLFKIQDLLSDLFMKIGAPVWMHDAIVLGIYRVLAWVVSVMLPPMAIFFPLFTLLEDSGYLPRIAYNLDKPFKKCCACGKQSLTMCLSVFMLLSLLYKRFHISQCNQKQSCNIIQTYIRRKVITSG